MTKRVAKFVALAMAGSVAFGWLGCLGGGGSWWSNLLVPAALYAGLEFGTDNDSVFDLFEDGAAANTNANTG